MQQLRALKIHEILSGGWHVWTAGRRVLQLGSFTAKQCCCSMCRMSSVLHNVIKKHNLYKLFCINNSLTNVIMPVRFWFPGFLG